MGEWERRDLKLEGTGGVGVGGLLSVCRDPPSNYSFPRGEGSGSNEQGERGRQRVQISCSICSAPQRRDLGGRGERAPREGVEAGGG